MADMNVTPARAGLTPLIWDSDFFAEYVRRNQFAKYMGTATGSLIQVREDLTRKAGDTVVFPAMRRLVGAGVTGNTILEGNEEVLNLRSLNLVVSAFRHAVAVSDWDEQKSIVDLREAAREALMTWELEKMRSDIITIARGDHRRRQRAGQLRRSNRRPAQHLDGEQRRPRPVRPPEGQCGLRRHGDRTAYPRLPRRPDEHRYPDAGQAHGTHRQSAHPPDHRQRRRRMVCRVHAVAGVPRSAAWIP